jgi:hypothetical protein
MYQRASGAIPLLDVKQLLAADPTASAENDR